ENTLYRFSSDAGNGWLLDTRRLIDGIDVGTASVPAIADLDGDGQEDLVVANSISDDVSDGQLFYFRRGADGFEFQDSTLVDDNLGFSLSPDFGDLNDDGLPDLVVGRFDGTIAYLSNNGPTEDPMFTLISTDLVGTDVGSNAAPALVDLDGDSDLDLVVGESSGLLNYFENVGSRTDPSFLEVIGFFSAFDVGQNSAPAAYDANQSGFYHLFVGSESEGLFYLENSGTPEAPQFADLTALSLNIPSKSAPVFYYGADEFPDLIVGNVAGGLLYFENETIGGSSAPGESSAPSRLLPYPNPADGTVTIDLPIASRNSRTALSVVDALGREQMTIQLSSTVTRIDIQTGSLASGIYMILLSGDDRTIAKGLLVVL
ncbi:MAG: T9SS type A sorting domain-containing protein, partial [Rhodothermales bacterium]|nr:T9SS type A sorting domain-containing protein [Rhodothermales bacterium]